MSLVIVEADGPVTTITLDRPEARNALDRHLSTALAGALRVADADPAVRAVVLTGTDPAFCAGQDLRELAGDPTIVQTTPPDESPYATLAAMTTPVVGAINGACATGGLEVALWCDFLVASERARFADTHARVGAIPGGGMTANLTRRVGLAMAKELSLTGRWVDAPEALRIGLVNRVVAHEALPATATGIAHEIAAGRPGAVAAIKALYDDAWGMTVAEAHRLEAERFAEWRIDGAALAGDRETIQRRGRS